VPAEPILSPGAKLRTVVDPMVPGILATLAVAFAAARLGTAYPIVGAPIFAILLGIVVQSCFGLHPALKPGVAFTSKRILQGSIVLMGAGLSMGEVWRTGAESLTVMLTTLSVGLLTAVLLGRLMGVDWRLTSLIGAGTAICGASAIAAVSPVVEAEEDQVAYSISSVFFFNVVAVFLFPVAGHLLQMQDHAFGLWAGTAINDTSSVVAAGYSWSQAAGNYATIVKLARTTMIVPVTMVFYLWSTRQALRSSAKVSWVALVPWFVVGFLAMVGLRSLGLLPPLVAANLTALGKFGIAMALAAVGLGSNLGRIRKTGFRPILLGMAVWVAVAVTSLIVQGLIG